MKEKIILDLCGGTGSWSAPYKKAGYIITIIDIKSGFDVRLLEKMDLYKHQKIYGILAAPPCTEFSFAKHFHGKGNYQHNFLEGLSIVDACLRAVIIYQPQFWCLENPKGYLHKWLGKPKYIFEPWMYGENYQKKTCLWEKFNIPKPTIKLKPSGLVKFSMLKSKEIHPEFYGKLSRTERRAITPQGFAKAFFKANK